MYDLQSSPMPIIQTIKNRLKKHFFDMARLIHQPFQQPTNVKMAWLHSDDHLAISIMKRTSKISKLGESLEIEAIDDFESNLAKASRRYNNSGHCRHNLSKINATAQASSKGAASSSLCQNEDDTVIFDDDDDKDDDNKHADEISLELKLYDHGPVYLTDLGSTTGIPPTFRSRTRRSLRYRPSSRISSNDVDDLDSSSTSNFDQAEDGDDGECDASDMMSDEEDNDDNNFHLSDSDDCQERSEPSNHEEPQYELVPPIWCTMQPGQRLSTIYVKPAVACFDLTDASPGMYCLQSQT